MLEKINELCQLCQKATVHVEYVLDLALMVIVAFFAGSLKGHLSFLYFCVLYLLFTRRHK